MSDQQQSENPRQTCPKCAATYRYDVDFQEHKNVGCKVKSAKKKSPSLKDDPDSSSKE